MSYLTAESYVGFLRSTTGLEFDVTIDAFDEINRFVHGQLENIDVLHAAAIAPYHLAKKIPVHLNSRNHRLHSQLRILREQQQALYDLEQGVLSAEDPVKTFQRLFQTKETPPLLEGDPAPGILNIFTRLRAELAIPLFGGLPGSERPQAKPQLYLGK